MIKVKDLKRILEKFDDDLVCVLYRAGKGHHGLVLEGNIIQIDGDDAYFPDNTVIDEGTNLLNIGTI